MGEEVRQTENFNLGWYFFHGDEEQIPGQKETDSYRKVKLPHDWSLEYPFDQNAPSCGSGGYVETGIGWYRKLFQVNPKAADGRRVILSFEGAYMLTRVWINGQYLGQHVYGYTPFSFDITEFLEKDGSENVIDVRVDNSAQPSSRWYSGSGITRNVWISSVQELHLAPYGVWIRQPQVNEQKAVLLIETRAEKTDASEEKLPVKSTAIETETVIFAPDGTVCASGKAEAKHVGGSRGREFLTCEKFEIEQPLLWDTEHPNLYRVETRIYEQGMLKDEAATMMGLRSAVFTPDQGFLLNGKQVKLNGVCIHHDGGCVGAAVPLPIWERRLKKIKEMGANAVRMSHNPPDPALLDLCDRMGLLVMDEAFDEWRVLKGKELGSNTHESRGYSEWFDSCHEEDLTLMLRRDRNHPCIVIWSIGNEVPDQTTEDGHLTARRLKGICKMLDPERAVTQANDQICAEPRRATDAFLNELDVVGYNYVGRWRTRRETLYDDDKRANPAWCMIGTENPGVGGIRGEYQMEVSEKAGWWTYPYFSAPVEVGRVLRYTMTHDYVSGDFMWTGVDYLGEAHWPARSATSGVLDTAGFEKDSYYFYQSIWDRERPMAHLMPHWNLEVEEGTIVQVLGFTNCDYAELVLNGKSYGRKSYSYPAYGMTEKYGHYDKVQYPVSTDNLFLSWDVPYEPGCIELIGYQDGRETVRHTVFTAGEPFCVRLVCCGDTMKGDGLDVVQIEAEVLDDKGNLCVQADTELFFEVEGDAAVIAVDNGSPREMQSAKLSHIHAFHGKALAILQSDEIKEKVQGESRNCQVTVHAQNVQGDCVKIRIVQ